jgi:hypothetical protein
MRDLADPRVLAHISSLLVMPPQRIMLGWAYGKPGEQFPGFLVLNHAASGTGIAYCQHGFGPQSPWGLIFTDRESPPSIGTEGWYPRFLNAYFESKAPAELDIWRVRKRGPSREAEWLTGDLSWDEAWGRVMALRQADPSCGYTCEQAVSY